MRNLKKALALVLALMMTLSLMVTVSASDYVDAADVDYDEAVTVMSAIGVFNGTDGGNFDPDGNLTRAQAAKIITYMLLGQKVADALPNTGSKFADCPDGRWYVGAVNYLTDLGVVAGRNDTTFDPNGNVTGIEFGKMLLGALGYDAQKEKLVGVSSWATNIAILSRGAELDKGMTTSVLNSNALTRQQACQMAFNAEQAPVQYYDDSFSFDITTSDGTHIVQNNKSRDDLANNTGKGYKTSGNDKVMQFCEMYSTELKLDASYAEPDCFGRESSRQWLVNGEAVYTGYDKLAAVFTGPAGVKDVREALEGYDFDASKFKGVVENGSNNGWNISKLVDTNDSQKDGINEITDAGVMVEVYANEDKEITQVVTFTYTLDSIKRISTASNGNVTYVFDKNGSKTNKADNTQTEVILEGEVNVGDTVTWVKGSEDEIYHVYPTTTMTGKQTVFNNNSKVVTINGEKYPIGTAVANVPSNPTVMDFPNSNTDATYYLDVNGFIVKRDGPAVADNFVLITGTLGWLSGSVDGNTGYAQVRAILSDGSVGVYNLEIVAKNGNYLCGDVTLASTGANNQTYSDAVNDLNGKVYQYSLNDDNALQLKALVSANGDSTTVTEDANNTYAIGGKDKAGNPADDNKAYTGGTSHKTFDNAVTALMSANTTFVVYKGTGADTTASVVKGTSGLSLDANGATGVAVITGKNTTGTAKVVFLKDEKEPEAEIVDYVYVDATKYEQVIDADGTNLRQYTGIKADGTEVSVYGPGTGTKVLAKNGLYSYDEDNMVSTDSCEADSDATTLNPSADPAVLFAYVTPKSVDGGALMEVNGQHYNVTGDTEIVYVDQTATGWEDHVCYVVLNAKKPANVDAIFIVPTPAS